MSCLSGDAIFKLKNLWNVKHSEDKIITNDKKEIWNILRDKMKTSCKKESCWLKQQFTEHKMDKELEESFVPESPESWNKNKNEWLSSVDIDEVMKQYEKAYKCFEFVAVAPIDFDTRKSYGTCVVNELCNFSLEDQIKKGKTKIGIIFNTDPHDKGGSHWMSMFINIKQKLIYFFDSTGDPPMPQITSLVNRIINQGSQLKNPVHFKYEINTTEHQLGDTECGIFSLFFIIHMLEDKVTPKYLKDHKLRDAYMNNFRKIYFRPANTHFREAM